MVKLLMSWDIKPGSESDYFEFIVREFAPGIMKLGVQPTESWYTVFGRTYACHSERSEESLKSRSNWTFRRIFRSRWSLKMTWCVSPKLIAVVTKEVDNHQNSKQDKT